MKTYAYYPGCGLSTLASEYDISFRNLCARLGIELEEVPGWICCGAVAACSSSRLFGVTLPLKNIALAFENGYTDIVTPCSACFYHFKKALHEIETNELIRRDAEDVIGVTIDRPIRIIHPLELFSELVEPSEWKHAIVQDLSHLNVACYYGCLLTRPPKVLKFDHAEYPQAMDTLLRRVGVPTVEWSYKTDCCGAFFASINPDVVVDFTYRILENARGAGANAVAVGCPVCHLNLDARQADIERKYGTRYDLPVFYFTQLMGAALGIDESGLGLWRHVVDPQPLMSV